MQYKLDNLSPPEFTELVGDLLSDSLLIKLTKSPEGPDGGIDLLKAGLEARPDLVVQCKHYWKSPFSILFRDLKKEVSKVRRIDPKRYLVSTSIELSLSQKRKIVALFEGYIASIDDVLGLQDINALLRSNERVERNHYKLWLGSTTLLRKVLHQGTSVWKEQLRVRLDDHKQIYVQTPSFSKALDILNKHRVLLVVGGPGVGKTTLANVLSARLVSQGFEFREIIDLDQEIKDLPETGNVVMYYDDFLGHSVWRDTRPGSEKRLERLIRLAESNNRFWLILTTRTYLLEDARKVSSAVEQRLGSKNEVVLNIDELSVSIRARILYNHLYFSRVSPEHCRSLTDWKKLESILNHRNFSPRIIEDVTRAIPDEISPGAFADFIEDQLRQPKSLYRSAINDRIGAEARDLLFALHVLGEPAELGRLYDVWSTLRLETERARENKDSLQRKLKALDANLGKLSKLYAKPGVEPRDGFAFYNPGVGEMVRDLLWIHDDRWSWFCSTAETAEELLNLARCHPEARPTFPPDIHAVQLPEVWYSRWWEIITPGLVIERSFITSFARTLELRVWDGHKNKLLEFLEYLHKECSHWSKAWSELGQDALSDSIRQTLSTVPWMRSVLISEAEDFTPQTWNDDDAMELFSRLKNLGNVGDSASLILRDAGRKDVNERLNSMLSDEEVSEEEYSELIHVNDGLRLGLDSEIRALEEYIPPTKTRSSTYVAKPRLGDDLLSEVEVKGLFESLADTHRHQIE